MSVDQAAPTPEIRSQPRGPQPAAETAEADLPTEVAIGQQAAGGRPPMTARRMIRLQRSLGNSHVQRLVEARQVGRSAVQPARAPEMRIQRVQVNAGTMKETLQSGTDAGNNFVPQRFEQGANYEMTRNDPAKTVLVNVRIKFVNRAPAADGSRDGADTEIPASDPRRGFATSMCTQLVGAWNGKFVLVGKLKPTAGGAAPGPPRRPPVRRRVPRPAALRQRRPRRRPAAPRQLAALHHHRGQRQRDRPPTRTRSDWPSPSRRHRCSAPVARPTRPSPSTPRRSRAGAPAIRSTPGTGT